jgi:uncharacterized protein YgbK (DUF1537 family)
MGLQVAIIADDLSGALDATAPFAAQGFDTAVACSCADLPAILDRSAVAISTASRHLANENAADQAERAARILSDGSPSLIFKKIDSRLKGNLQSEVRALLKVFPRQRVIVAPAIPALGRFVVSGQVVGHGVAVPLAVRERFGELGATIEVPDAEDEDAIDRIAGECLDAADAILAVGARGLADGLARRLVSKVAARSQPPLAMTPPLAFVIGSQDPITLRQIDALRAAHPKLRIGLAPNGNLESFAGDVAAEHTLFLCTKGTMTPSPTGVAERFARNVAEHVRADHFATLIVSGGDTVAALLAALGVGIVYPRGEIRPGVPWSTVTASGLKPVVLVTKSGGFGNQDILASLAKDFSMVPRDSIRGR